MAKFNDGVFEVRARLHDWSDNIQLWVRGCQGNKEVVGIDVIVENVIPGKMHSPTMEITKGVAQVLMDDLWKAGLRPTEGAGSAGSLAATQRHLDDMRRIVEKKLGVKF